MVTLSIDADERTPAVFSSVLPRLRVHRWQGTEPPPPADVQITIARSLPAHLIREILAEAADQLTADTGPHLKLGPTKRKALT